MTWKGTLVNRLRYLIGDFSTTPDYSSLVLEQFIALAAVCVDSDLILSTTFSIDTDTPDISPDPTGSSIDIGISNLFVLKAACIIAQSELRKDASKYGIKVKDDLSSYDGTAALGSKKSLREEMCDFYDSAKKEWSLGNRAAGKAIFGPYASADGLPFIDGYNRWGRYR